MFTSYLAPEQVQSGDSTEHGRVREVLRDISSVTLTFEDGSVRQLSPADILLVSGSPRRAGA